ncbi:hypothetical protein [Desulfitobacterium sp. AusDCA]|uniref:hypothetical protein n=1 Tax=Desulfitobacterium sp. AusDCA TaxID=3240383 RepID=UPI003DA7338C
MMQPFFQTEANDNAYSLLVDYAEKIYGHFDDAELQLFNEALLIAFEAKVLTKTSYQQLKAWHDHTRHQMADDSVIEDNICRTFYGFVYEKKDGTRDCFFDAQEMTTVHHQQEMMLHGEFIGPIVQKSYWFRQFDQMSAIRRNYRKWLMDAENEIYLQQLKAIRSQQGVIDKDALCLVSKKLIDYSEAHAAIDYYDAIWNKK